MTYLVFGVTGRTGLAVAKLAVEKGEKVVGVIRDPAQAADLEKQGINSTVLDISSAHPKAYVDLLHKVKPAVVVWAAGTGVDSLGRTIDYHAQVNVYDAMVKTGTQRVLAVSSMGVWDKDSKGAEWFNEDDHKRVDRLRDFVPHIVQAKYDAESHLRTLKLDWTVIRPGGLNLNEAGGVSLGKVHVGMVPRATVAAVLLESVGQKGMHGRVIDCIEGTDSPAEAVHKVIKGDIDTWV